MKFKIHAGSSEAHDLPEQMRQRLGRPVYRPRNHDGRLRRPLAHHWSLSQSVNKIAYRTTWGERTDRQRRAMTRVLVNRFDFPWQRMTHGRIARFYNAFTSDESVALGTWAATPFEVATMLEKGFRGASLARQHLILAWNDIPVTQPVASSSPGLSRELFRALRDAVATTAPAAVVHGSSLTLAGKTGTTDGGRDAWFVGFLLPARRMPQDRILPRITFVLWAGYDDNRPAGLYGGKVHGPVFRRFLRDSRVQATLQGFFHMTEAVTVR